MADRVKIENGRIIEHQRNYQPLGEIEWVNNDSLLFAFGTAENPLRDRDGNPFNFPQLFGKMVCQMREFHDGDARITFSSEDGSLSGESGMLKFSQPLASTSVSARSTLFGDVECTTPSGRTITLFTFSIKFSRDYTSVEGVFVPTNLQPVRVYDAPELHPLSIFNLIEGQDIVSPTARITPRNGSVGTSVTGPFSIVFNEEVRHREDGKPVTDAIKLKNRFGDDVPITVTQSGTVTFYINPVNPLNPGEDYTIVITENLTDVAKNRLISTSASFTTAIEDVTAPVPTINVAEGASIPKDFEFSNTFDEEVYLANGGIITQNNVLGAFDVVNKANNTSVPLQLVNFSKPSGRVTLRFRTTSDLLPGGEYKLVVNNIADKAGNAIVNYTVNFKIEATVVQIAPSFILVTPTNPAIPLNAPIGYEVATLETDGNPIGVFSLPPPFPGAPNNNDYFEISGNKVLLKKALTDTANKIIGIRSTNAKSFVYKGITASIQPPATGSPGTNPPPSNIRLSDTNFNQNDLPWTSNILYAGGVFTSIRLNNHTDKFEIVPGQAQIRTRAGYIFPNALTIYSVSITVVNAGGSSTQTISIRKEEDSIVLPNDPVPIKRTSLSLREADHLKRRLGMGIASMGDTRFVGETPEQAVTAMLQPETIHEPFVTLHTTQANVGKDRGPVVRWFLANLLESQGAQARLAYFFHVVLPSADGASRLNSQIYWQGRMFLEVAGDSNATLKDLIWNFSVDNLESRMLNNNQNGDFNSDGEPTINENYAREFLELYTVGKREAQPYTETDVQEAAKVLSGWRESETANESKGGYTTFKTNFFDPDKHIWGVKRFSTNFQIGGAKGDQAADGTATIGGPRPSLNGGTVADDIQAGRDELQALIDLTFDQNRRANYDNVSATAMYWTTRLHRFFGNKDETEDLLNSFIVPIAKVLEENNWNIHIWLKAYFTSELFYDADELGNIHKSPLEVVSHTLRIMNVPLPKLGNTATAGTFDNFYRTVEARMNFMGYRATESTRFYAPDDAFGYFPYYQVPAYDEGWNNSDDTADMQFFAAEFLQTGFAGIRADLFQMYLDNAPRSVSDVSEPTTDPDTFVRFFMSRIFESYDEISEERQINFVGDKERLEPGEDGGGSLLQGDVYNTWNGEYQFQYKADGESSALESRLKTLFREYHRVLEFFYF